MADLRKPQKGGPHSLLPRGRPGDVERAVGAYPAPHGPAATAGGAPAAATSPDIACATSTTAWATLSEGGLGRRGSLR